MKNVSYPTWSLKKFHGLFFEKADLYSGRLDFRLENVINFKMGKIDARN